MDRSIASPEAFIRTNVHGHIHAAGAGEGLLDWRWARRTGRRSAFCTFRRMRCTARWARRSGVQRRDGLRAQQPLCGFEGGIGSSGAGVLPHIRAAGADHELLEQLRAVSVSGEVDSAGDSECAGGQAAAGLRRREECARLAVCGRSLRGDPGGLENGRLGETYNIGGNSERTNIDVVTAICDIVDEMRPRTGGSAAAKLITYVKDRPDTTGGMRSMHAKIARELGWKPAEEFESGLRKTVRWYLEQWRLGGERADRRLSRVDREELRGAAARQLR